MNEFLSKNQGVSQKEMNKYEAHAVEMFDRICDMEPDEQVETVNQLKIRIRQYWEGLASRSIEDIARNQKRLEELKMLNEKL